MVGNLMGSVVRMIMNCILHRIGMGYNIIMEWLEEQCTSVSE